jgi:Ca-activated chloride channel family protein
MPYRVEKMINLSEFHLIRPFWLLALLPWLIIISLTLKKKLNQGNWSNVCDAELLPYILQEKAVTQSHWTLSTMAVATFLSIIALAGPTWERLPTPVFRNAAALVIVLDLSRSMDAEDVKPSRLIRARYKIADILKRRKDGQTALLVYAGDVFVVTQLTEDIDTINNQLSVLTTGIMPVQGSNTALALEKAVDLFKQAGLPKGQILLVTDGVQMDKTLPTVESLDSYKLSILGVGTTEGAPIKISGGGFLKDRQGNIVIAKLDLAELTRLAQVGGGTMQMITGSDRDIEELTSTIDSQTTQQANEQGNDFLLEQWHEKSTWLLLLILPLAVFSFRRGVL